MPKQQKTHRQHGKKGFIKDQRRFFDKLVTQDWEHYKDKHWDRTRTFEVNQILKCVPSPNHVLNVGCGSGFQDRIFALNDSVTKVIGIDYSSDSVIRANQTYPHQKVKREVSDLFEYDKILSKYGQFDVVVSFQVIEHLSNVEDFFDTCKSLTKQGGYIAIVTPNYHTLINQIKRFLRMQVKYMDPLHFDEYTFSDLIKFGRRFGLEPVYKFGHSISLPPPLHHIDLLQKSKLNLLIGSKLNDNAHIIGVVFKNV